jgi:hypothetical protein
MVCVAPEGTKAFDERVAAHLSFEPSRLSATTTCKIQRANVPRHRQC